MIMEIAWSGDAPTPQTTTAVLPQTTTAVDVSTAVV
jgi:hypothetical protein